MNKTSNKAGDRTKASLIQKTLDYILANGLRGHSLRSIASEIGTTHRILSYHFGSKEEFIAEVIDYFFSSWLQVVSETPIENCATSSEAMLLLWDRVTHPDVFIYSRIGIELVSWKSRQQSLSQLLPESVWAEPLERISRLSNLNPANTEVDIRVLRAMLRGLLYQLAATNDLLECRRTLLDFLDWRERSLQHVVTDDVVQLMQSAQMNAEAHPKRD